MQLGVHPCNGAGDHISAPLHNLSALLTSQGPPKGDHLIPKLNRACLHGTGHGHLGESLSVCPGGGTLRGLQDPSFLKPWLCQKRGQFARPPETQTNKIKITPSKFPNLWQIVGKEITEEQQKTKGRGCYVTACRQHFKPADELTLLIKSGADVVIADVMLSHKSQDLS